MNKQRFIRLFAALFLMGIMGTSCVSVKAYEKMYLNDSDMVLSSRKVENYQNTFLYTLCCVWYGISLLNNCVLLQ